METKRGGNYGSGVISGSPVLGPNSKEDAGNSTASSRSKFRPSMSVGSIRRVCNFRCRVVAPMPSRSHSGSLGVDCKRGHLYMRVHIYKYMYARWGRISQRCSRDEGRRIKARWPYRERKRYGLTMRSIGKCTYANAYRFIINNCASLIRILLSKTRLVLSLSLCPTMRAIALPPFAFGRTANINLI